jgi:A/G-specific adenine glycosylase
MLTRTSGFSRRLLHWYDQHQRALPWRSPTPDPYLVLVSEAMLQQTQVATVIPYFQRFIVRYPTVQSLAGSTEQDVLKLWQGLGYYSRARNLRAAAKKIVEEFGGNVPQNLQDLLSLPGVGRYTAGAVASIAFGRRAPILDGNVARVLCRLDRVETDPREPAPRDKLWERAEQILPKSRLGDFNSALMELGALVCTPRSPQCLLCPLRPHCAAAAAGVQEQLPVKRQRKATPMHHRSVFCVRDGVRYLIEQRPPRGRWAGMWQFATVEANGEPVSARLVKSHLSLRTTPPKRIGQVLHALTHRRYTFDIYECEAKALGGADSSDNRRWVTLSEIAAFPLPGPHVKVAQMLLASR